MALLDLHVAFAWVMIVANAAVGVWALAAHRWPRLRQRALWVAVVLAELTVFVQVILGVAALQDGEHEPAPFHELYGFSAIFAVGILYAYRPQLAAKQHLLYGLGSLFIMGLGLRAMAL